MLKEDRQNAINCLTEIKQVFDQASVRFVLTDGLVLAYARYKDLMDWDLKDIDIGIFEFIDKEKKNEIRNCFIAKGFGNRQSILNPIAHLKSFLGVQKYKIKVAIYYYEKKGQYFDALYASGMGKRRWLAKWFINPQCVQFLGNEYYIPNDIDDYLANAYGKDWKTNIIKDENDWKYERKRHPELYPYPKLVRLYSISRGSGLLKISKEDTIEGLKAIKSLFDDFNIPFVLIGGLVLGYARYKDIMDWDVSDIDMGVFVPVPNEIQARFWHMFEEIKIHNHLKVCIKFWEHKGEYFETLSYNRKFILREHERWFLNPQPVEFLDTTFLIPDKVEDYLDNHYAKDWRTNIIKGIPEWLKEHAKHPEKYPYGIRIAI